MNEIRDIVKDTHFTNPDIHIQQLFIQTFIKFDLSQYTIKFSWKENPHDITSALIWVIITSLNPFKAYTGAWMMEDKFINSQMWDYFDEVKYYNDCIEFCKNCTLESLLEIIKNSEIVR